MSDLNIDPNTLNGYGIITINLSSNHVDSNAIQYVDLNTDYFIYQGLCNNKSCYFVTNYVLKQDKIYKLHGPFKTSTEAITKFTDLDYSSLLNVNDKYLKYTNGNITIVNSTNSTTYTDIDFDFFALVFAYSN